jgi:uncharacterized protein
MIVYHIQLGLNVFRSLAVWAYTLFGLTSLALWYLWMRGINPDVEFSPIIPLIAYAPSLAALFAAVVVPRGLGLRVLLRQLFIWRVSVWWYVLALLGPFMLVLVASFLYVMVGGPLPSHWFVAPEASVIIGPLIAGSLGEELGWRGFAQRLLQRRYSILAASVLVGMLWATWHTWPALAPGGGVHADPLLILLSYVRLISAAVIYGWIYARTGGSVLLVMLAHAAHNLAIAFLPGDLFATITMPLIISVLYLAAAILLVSVKSGQLLRRPTD